MPKKPANYKSSAIMKKRSTTKKHSKATHGSGGHSPSSGMKVGPSYPPRGK